MKGSEYLMPGGYVLNVDTGECRPLTHTAPPRPKRDRIVRGVGMKRITNWRRHVGRKAARMERARSVRESLEGVNASIQSLKYGSHGFMLDSLYRERASLEGILKEVVL